jgi:magnesium transporter
MNTDMVDVVRSALREGDSDTFASTIEQLNPAAWANVIPRLPASEVIEVWNRLPPSAVPEILARLQPDMAGRILSQLLPAQAAELLGEMKPDDATDILISLPAPAVTELLGGVEATLAVRLRQLMTYRSDSAGGRMTPAFLAVLPETRADDAITLLRETARQTETIYYIYVVTDEQEFLGVLSLRELIVAAADVPVRELIAPQTVTVAVDTDQEEAARLLTEWNLLALPVLDDRRRLVGIITADDVADVLKEEATEDIVRLGGSQPLNTTYRHATISLLFRKRIVWLMALFVAEAYTGSVMRFFEDELDQVVALAFFIPLLLGTGGNVGSQITTTLVRALAVEEIKLRDLRWILGKETSVGLVIGAVMAGIAYLRAELLGVGADVAFVVAITIAVISVWSSVVAAILPLALRKLRFDPTVVSAPFITTLVDGTGLIIYFSIAKGVLNL